MPLDTRIALGAQPLQLENQLAQYGQAVGIQNAMQQNQLGQMQMSAAQRTMQEEEGAKSFLSTNPDLNNVENQRRLLAFGKTGLAYGKAFLDQRKASQDSDKTAAEILGLNQKNFTAFNSPMRAAAGGIPGITAYVEAMYADPVLGALAKKIKPKEQALKENIEMYTKDPDQWITAHSNLEGAQMLDALKMNAASKAEADYQAFRGQPVAGAPAAAAPGTVNATPVVPTISPAAGIAIKPIAKGVFADSTVSLENIRQLEKLGDQATFIDPTSYWTQNSDGKLAVGRSGAPVSAAAPMAPAAQPDMANALAMKIQSLEAQQNQLEPFLKSSNAKAKYDELGKRIDKLSEGFSISPDGTYVLPNVGTFKGAPSLSETQKEVAVLADPNASKEAKDAATKRIAKLVDIPAKSVDGAIERFEYAVKNSGYKGTFTDFVVLSTPKTNIRVDAGSKAEEVEYGQYVVNQYKEVSARADVATRSLPALDINLKILDKGFDTGFGTETIAAGAKVLAALGVQNAKDFATDSQTFLANANSAVLQKQLEQKGVQTAADADRITSTGAQLGNTKEANKFIISVAKAQLQRDVAQRKFYSDWRTKNETFRGAEDAWYAGPGGASLFDSPILKKYAEPAATAGQTEARKAGLDDIFKKAP